MGSAAMNVDHNWNQKWGCCTNQELNEKCLLMHCHCNSLNLAFEDAVKNIPLLKDTLDMAYSITKLIKKSP